MNFIKDVIISFIIAIIAILAICGLCSILNKPNYSSSVEERKEVKLLITTNDSIKLKVEHLDSVKNAKVIEVISLDNDSTVKLFYELVSE